MEKGDIVYIVENRRKVTEVVITFNYWEFVYGIVADWGEAIRLPRGRIYKTRLEAEKQLVYKPIKKERTPYDYM